MWCSFMLNKVGDAAIESIIPLICGILNCQIHSSKASNGGCQGQQGKEKWKDVGQRVHSCSYEG